MRSDRVNDQSAKTTDIEAGLESCEAETHVFENVIDELMGAMPLWAMHRISILLRSTVIYSYLLLWSLQGCV